MGSAAAFAIVLALLTGNASSDASAAPTETKVVLVGVVTAIYPVKAVPPSRKDWGVTVRVETVKAGSYKDSSFTFTVHSPSRSGLIVGNRYTIEATSTERGYLVDDTQWR